MVEPTPKSKDFAQKINNVIYPRRSAYLQREGKRQAEFQAEVKARKENSLEGK
jgi:hypothetical protein